MDNATFQRIKDLIAKHQAVSVLVGPNPTIDEMGAGLGMFLALQQIGKQAAIASPSDPTVEVSSLVGINKVQKVLGGGSSDLTVSFPYRDGEIDKVSYTLENNYLNIVVKAGPNGLSFQERDVQFKRANGAAPTLLFIIGVPRLTDLGGTYDPQLLKDTIVVNIDNKADNQGYGDIAVVSSKFSSVSEQVADFLTLLEPQIELDADTSQNLLSGILYATNDFQNTNTSYLAFEMAGILMKKGAKRAKSTAPIQAPVVNSSFFPPLPQQRPTAPSPFKSMPQFRPQPQPYRPVTQAPQWQPSQQLYRPPVKPAWQAPQFTPSVQAAPTFTPPVAPPAYNPPPAPTVQTPPVTPFDQSQGKPAPVNTVEPMQVEDQSQANQPAPADWLTPKVYKGSTIL